MYGTGWNDSYGPWNDTMYAAGAVGGGGGGAGSLGLGTIINIFTNLDESDKADMNITDADIDNFLDDFAQKLNESSCGGCAGGVLEKIGEVLFSISGSSCILHLNL